MNLYDQSPAGLDVTRKTSGRENHLKAMALPSDPVHGRCLVFAWGPPWNWIPSFQRSRMHAGWSLTWLSLGLYWLPYSLSLLITKGVYARCSECCLHVYDPLLGTVPYFGSEKTTFLCQECELNLREDS